MILEIDFKKIADDIYSNNIGPHTGAYRSYNLAKIMAIDVIQSLMDYTHESKCILGQDERTAEELFNIYIKEQEGK